MFSKLFTFNCENAKYESKMPILCCDTQKNEFINMLLDIAFSLLRGSMFNVHIDKQTMVLKQMKSVEC